MEIVSRGYWQKIGYERLNGSGRRRRKRTTARVQIGSTRKRRFWRIKIVPKLKVFKTASPKKFLVWLRDAYVKMMLRLSNSRVMTSSYSGVVSDGFTGFGRGPVREYDEKTIIEIYKSLVLAHGHLVPRDAAKLGSQAVCRVR